MLTLTHFFTGYLLAFLFKDKQGKPAFRYDNFVPLFLGMVATLPDLIEFVTPSLSHATWSHTLVFALIAWPAYTALCYFVAPNFFKTRNVAFARLLGLAFLAIISHFLLDICTHQHFQCEQATADGLHIYFWPVWDQSFHLDCLFGWSYLTRTLIEWAIYFPIIFFAIVYRWRALHENIFHIFNWRRWGGAIPIERRELIGMGLIIYTMPIGYLVSAILSIIISLF